MKYWYQLTARPADSWTTPEGEGREFREQDLPRWAKRGHGQVGYNEPLSLTDVKRFELVPITTTQELNGTKATIWGNQGNVTVDENCFVWFDFGGQHKPEAFPYLEFMRLTCPESGNQA